MKTAFALAASIAAITMPATVFAAQADYFLKIEGVEGEARVAEWSFGACNAGQCSTIKSPRDAASGLATGKRQHKPGVTASQNTQSLRESPTSTHSHHESDASAGRGAGAERTATYDLKTNKGARATGGVNMAAGDLDGDGAADLAYAATLDEVSSFSLTFQKIEASYSKVCMGKHIASAQLRVGADTYALTDVTVNCTSSSTSTPKQTQGATFGERCDGGVCAADDWTTMTLTGGQMKHTKTGHVTILK